MDNSAGGVTSPQLIYILANGHKRHQHRAIFPIVTYITVCCNKNGYSVITSGFVAADTSVQSNRKSFIFIIYNKKVSRSKYPKKMFSFENRSTSQKLTTAAGILSQVQRSAAVE